MLEKATGIESQLWPIYVNKLSAFSFSDGKADRREREQE